MTPDVEQRLVPTAAFATGALGRHQRGQKRQRPNAPRPGDRGEQHQAHPAQPARLDEVAVGGANRITVDTLGRDPLAAAALDRVVQSQDHGAALRERVDEEAEQDAAADARAPRSAVEDAVDVHKPPLLRAAHDAQDACHRVLPWREDRADQQVLGVSPRAVDEQRCERQDDPGEAGGQRQHGGVSWRGRHQPIRHARFVTSAHSMRRKWPKSS